MIGDYFVRPGRRHCPGGPRRGREFGLWLSLLLACGQTWAGQRLVAWGDITYDSATNAGRVTALSQPVWSISAGSFHNTRLMSDGTVEAWGDNRFNQTNVPDIFRFKPAMAIAAGNIHTVALLESGNVIAWGPLPGQAGDYGQCSVPADLGTVVKVAAGAVHTLALKSDGTVAAWGANLNGQCMVPAGLSSVKAIAGGMYHSLALRKDGTVVAWGDNSHGQASVPGGLSNVVAVAAGGYHSLAVRADGLVVSWGSYGLAQCGVPPDLSNVVAIATGDLHSLALKSDGTLVAWGFNTAGQCTIPPGLSQVVAITARSKHSMALIEEVPPRQPELRVELADGVVVVSWPLTDPPLALQQNPDLGPADWSSVAAIPKLVGTNYAVSLPTSEKMFFRLTGQ